MPRTKTQQDAMTLVEQIDCCGPAAKNDLRRLFREHGIENDPFFSFEYTAKHLEVVQEVYNLWHTTTKFKVGDKVYVVPLTPTLMTTCIRGTITEVSDNGWGYHLRAWKSDLPGIYMFNIWDKDLQPRTSKHQKLTPPELLIKRDLYQHPVLLSLSDGLRKAAS
jgi:hypothetical protein